MAALSEHMAKVSMESSVSSSSVNNNFMCDTCGVPSNCSSTCPLIYEEANALYSRLVNDPFCNTYNVVIKNHPNFSYKSTNVLNSPLYQ